MFIVDWRFASFTVGLLFGRECNRTVQSELVVMLAFIERVFPSSWRIHLKTFYVYVVCMLTMGEYN